MTAQNLEAYDAMMAVRARRKAAHDNQVELKRIIAARPDLKERAPMVEKLNDSIYAAQVALRAGIENTQELLADHEMRLGRTTRGNRYAAERLEGEIKQMQTALEGLAPPRGRGWPTRKTMKSKSDIENTSGGGCSRHDLFACAKVAGDPMAFAKRGDIFRGYYVVALQNFYMTHEGKWTNGCTAPEGGNWWNTQPEAAHALEKFRLANVKVHAPSPAGASVDNSVEPQVREEVGDKTAGDGCCVSSCSDSSFSLGVVEGCPGVSGAGPCPRGPVGPGRPLTDEEIRKMRIETRGRKQYDFGRNI